MGAGYQQKNVMIIDDEGQKSQRPSKCRIPVRDFKTLKNHHHLFRPVSRVDRPLTEEGQAIFSSSGGRSASYHYLFRASSKMPAPLPTIAAATALTLTTILTAILSTIIDANPSLYVYSNLLLSERKLRRTWSGSNVLLVGGSSGIGAELAELLALYGANVVITGRDRQRLNKVVEASRRRATIGTEQAQIIQPLPLDLTAPDRVLNRAIDAASAALPGGNIDVLILNAGQGQLLPALQTKHEITRDLMEVNFHGPVRFCKLVIMRNRWLERKQGHVVVTSSILGKMPGPLSSSYAAAKHAVQGYFGTLRSENDWLRVDLPCPGPIDTPFGKRSRSAGSSTKGGLWRRNKTAAKNSNVSEEGSYKSKMPARRCAELILASMTGPKSIFFETVITRQPTLGFSYLAQHLPTLANLALGKMGVLRQLVWEAGLPLYDSASFRKVAKIKQTEGR